MGLRAFVLLPHVFKGDESDAKFRVESYDMVLDHSSVILDIIKINCPSLEKMVETVSGYFGEVIQREATERNILMAKYLGMMDRIFRELPEGRPIPENVVEAVNQCADNRGITSQSGYFFMFEEREFDYVEREVRKHIGSKS